MASCTATWERHWEKTIASQLPTGSNSRRSRAWKRMSSPPQRLRRLNGSFAGVNPEIMNVLAATRLQAFRLHSRHQVPWDIAEVGSGSGSPPSPQSVRSTTLPSNATHRDRCSGYDHDGHIVPRAKSAGRRLCSTDVSAAWSIPRPIHLCAKLHLGELVELEGYGARIGGELPILALGLPQIEWANRRSTLSCQGDSGTVKVGCSTSIPMISSQTRTRPRSSRSRRRRPVSANGADRMSRFWPISASSRRTAYLL